MGERARDLWRQVLNLVFAIVEFVPAIVVGVTGLGAEVGARARLWENPAQPAPFAFVIWSVIYPAAVAYGIFQALPAQRRNPLLRRIGWYTLAAFIASTAWLIAAQAGANVWVLLLLIVALLVPLLVAVLRIAEAGNLTPAERAFVTVPVGLYAGWATVATVASVAVVITVAGAMTTGLALLLILTAGVVGVYYTFRTHGNFWYALAIAWGLFGILIANAAALNAPAAVAAGLMLVLVLLAVPVARLSLFTRALVALAAE